MKVTHEFTMHAQCPFITQRTVWDYYTVSVTLDCVVDVHEIEAVIADCCGLSLSQEALCQLLSSKLKGRVELTGKHSANSHTTVICGGGA